MFVFVSFSFFFFNDTATTEIYTLSLHDALPISSVDIPALTVSRSRFTTSARMWPPRRIRPISRADLSSITPPHLASRHARHGGYRRWRPRRAPSPAGRGRGTNRAVGRSAGYTHPDDCGR